MDKKKTKGIIYLKFEDASRPIPLLHLPKDLDHKLVTQIDNRIIDFYSEEEEKKEDKINIIDLESTDYRGIIIFEGWKQKNKYWGEAKTTIVVLTEEEKKTIEKEADKIEPLLKKYLRKIIHLEKNEGEKDGYLVLLQELFEKLGSS